MASASRHKLIKLPSPILLCLADCLPALWHSNQPVPKAVCVRVELRPRTGASTWMSAAAWLRRNTLYVAGLDWMLWDATPPRQAVLTCCVSHFMLFAFSADCELCGIKNDCFCLEESDAPSRCGTSCYTAGKLTSCQTRLQLANLLTALAKISNHLLRR